MKFDLVMPSRLLLSQEVDYVSISGEEGAFGVLPGHAPFISSLKPGAVTVRTGDKTQVFCVGFGLADVQPEGVTILAEEAVRREDIKIADVREKLTAVETRIRGLSHDEGQAVLLAKARKEQALLEAQLLVAGDVH